MSVSLLVPFRPDGAERDRNWTWLRGHYERAFPEWEIVEGSCEGRWSKGTAVNAAARAASGDVLVIADADVLVSEPAMREALAALDYSAWAVPHRLVFRLNEEATRAVIEGRLTPAPCVLPEDRLAESTRRGPAGGGIAALRHEDFDKAGGVDERFLDWGGEDESFARVLDTLVGPHRCLGNAMWHLWHEPMPRRPKNRASDESEALAAQYLEAAGNPTAMLDLLAQRPYEPVKGGGVVVTKRETLDAVPLDVRFEGWGQEDEAWGVALSTLAGAPFQGAADLVHLHHPLAERISRTRGNQESWELRRRYLEAQYDPDAMRSLIEESLCHSSP